MVGKWSCRNPITIEEREKIKDGLDMDMSYRQLSQHVGRSKSTVMREAKRLGDVRKYDPLKAQEHFEMKQRRGK
jgi:IS30 family transposase